MSQEKVTRLFKQLRQVDAEPEDKPAATQHDKKQQDKEDPSNWAKLEESAILSRLKGANQQVLLEIPRRGCMFEWMYAFEDNLAELVGVPESELLPRREAVSMVKASEMWREAECLALSPYSMSRLKQLPELQQIISHTTLDAIQTCGGNMLHLLIGQVAQNDADEAKEDGAPFITGHEQAVRQHCFKETASNVSLLQHLAPALRLCLAAEVAVGMLCPGQPPPPDTPEHAAALQMFVAEAFSHVQAELENTPHTDASRPLHNSPKAVEDQWQPQAQQQQQQQQQQQPLAGMSLPKLDRIPTWGLAPHMDLQLQLPPHQLLQVMCQLSVAEQTAQQQQQQQQQQGDSATESSAAAAAAAGEGGPMFEASSLHPKQQELLQQLFEHWNNTAEVAAAAAAAAAGGADAGVSNGGNASEQRSSAVVQACGAVVRLLQVKRKRDAPRQLDEGATAHHVHKNAQGKQQRQQDVSAITRANDDDSDSDDDDDSSSSSAENNSSSSSSSGSICATDHEQERNMQQSLVQLASCLIFRFIQGQWQLCGSTAAAAAAWQQAVPLQVLLLLAQLQQLQGHVQRAQQEKITRALQEVQSDKSVHPTSPDTSTPENGESEVQDDETVSANSMWAKSAETEQANLPLLAALQQVLGLVHTIRQFTAENEAFVGQRAPHEARPPPACQSSNSSSSSRGDFAGLHSTVSSSAGGQAGATSPVDFFSASGPLSSGVWGFAQPQGLGVWQPRDSHRAAAGHQAQPGNQAQPESPAESGPQAQPGCQARFLQQQTWQIVLGSCAWQQAVQLVNWDQVGHASDTKSIRQYLHSVLGAVAAVSPVGMLRKQACMLKVLAEAQDTPVDNWGCLSIAAVGEVLADELCEYRLAAFRRYGVDVSCLRSRALRVMKRRTMKQQQLETLTSGVLRKLQGSDLDDLDSSEEDGETLDLAAAVAAVASATGGFAEGAQQPGGCSSKADAACSSSNRNGVVTTARASPADATSKVTAKWDRQADISAGRQAARCVAGCVAQQLFPLHQWHSQWLQRYKQQAAAARDWWGSKARRSLAKQGARGKAAAELCSGTSAAASSSSSSKEGWSRGAYDYNAACPLCRDEQQQQQQQQSQPQTPPSSSSLFPNLAVPFDDPFMWRRLLWQLLGKLSPEAQAFYAHYMAMCPHCADVTVWRLVRRSVLHSLWTSPAGDAVQQQLALVSLVTAGRNAQRSERVQQYARALNLAFQETYQPSIVLVAQQLLVALSPLHAQVLPRPEVAFLVPSSFRPAIGKALQQQLLSRPVLDLFQHGRAVLQMWHVWWHIGIRRYGALKQQQQQQHGAAELSNLGQVDELYLDPDARVYAVGFATRHLSGSDSVCDDNSTAQILINDSDPSNTSSTLACSRYAGLTAACTSLRLIEQLRINIAVRNVDRVMATPDCSSSSSKLPAGAEDAVSLAVAWSEYARQQDTIAVLRTIAATEDSLLGAAAARQLLQQQQRAAAAGVGDEDDMALLYNQHGTLGSAAAAKRYQIWHSQRRLQKLVPASDIEQLALSAVCLIEALSDPAVWFVWQQQLLGHTTKCDYCQTQVDEDTWTEVALACPQCAVPQYCSSSCLRNDAALHATICKLIVEAQKRYRFSPSTDGSGPMAAAPGAFGRLQDILRGPDAEPSELLPLAVPASAVDALQEEAAVISPELFVQELGCAFAPAHNAMISYARANPGTPNPWVNPWRAYTG